MKVKDIKKKTPEGTFAGVKFDKETVDTILKFTKDNDIPHPLPASKIHTTLLYSRKYLPKYKPVGKLEKPLIGKFKSFEIFESSSDGDGKDSNCLVMRFDCRELIKRHEYLMDKHNATYDYPSYKPHITLTYDAGDFDPKSLPDFDKDIVITEEYGSELQLNWTQCKDSS